LDRSKQWDCFFPFWELTSFNWSIATNNGFANHTRQMHECPRYHLFSLLCLQARIGKT
jgi:hypothetical protein